MPPYNFEQLEGLEWLEANGLGGYASGTFSGSNSRRYHGLLIAATHPPAGRMVLLSKLDEALRSRDGRWELADNRFPGTLPGNSQATLSGFARDFFPSMEYQCAGLRLRKTVAALQGENSTLVRYELLEANAPVVLELKPLLSPRDYHSLSQANSALRWDYQFQAGLLALEPYSGVPGIFIQVPGAIFVRDQAWVRRFQYARERERGLDFEEDLFCYGHFEVALFPGRPLDVIISTEDPSGRPAEDLFKNEGQRRQALLPSGKASPWVGRLRLAADSFLAQRGHGLGTVMAGYPWFTDWGRDTMIALRGLCLSQQRWGQAKGIFEAFLQSLSQGMLPNRFPDGNEPPEYNTVDATLWLFVALHDYARLSGDGAYVQERCLAALLEILDWHRRGTRYGIKVDADGLLRAGGAGVQLTWMDAKVGDWVVTPRQGKAVEINALWYNALRITAGFCRSAGQEAQASALEAEAQKTWLAFQQAFWKADGPYCYDVLGPEGPDSSLRPNQIFCLSLPFVLLEGERAAQVLAAVESHLLTPRGLRSLSPQDARYVPRYEGGVMQRDGAYHQGTVWSWLLGPYVDALVKVKGEAGKAQALKVLQDFAPHLDEAGLGTVSEIFDAEAPHAPRGCIAQAWSVGELLRVSLDLGLQ
jgi:predicted glycogen debranching enzyme